MVQYIQRVLKVQLPAPCIPQATRNKTQWQSRRKNSMFSELERKIQISDLITTHFIGFRSTFSFPIVINLNIEAWEY